MDWTTEAEKILDRLLEHVPVAFRMMVERAAQQQAETVAERSGHGEVTYDDAVIGYIQVSPTHLRGNLRRSFEQIGIDVEKFERYL